MDAQDAREAAGDEDSAQVGNGCEQMERLGIKACQGHAHEEGRQHRVCEAGGRGEGKALHGESEDARRQGEGSDDSDDKPARRGEGHARARSPRLRPSAVLHGGVRPRPSLSRKTSGHFGKARNRAERLLRDPEGASKLTDDAESKISEKKKDGRLATVIDDVRTLIRLVRAYTSGEYRAVSWESMVLVMAALVYLVSPIDLIPDFLPGGLADDAVVVTFVIGMVREEIGDFRESGSAHKDRRSERAVQCVTFSRTAETGT